jgi:hypothetical protein
LVDNKKTHLDNTKDEKKWKTTNKWECPKKNDKMIANISKGVKKKTWSKH